eukprot:Tbor_TRINITY_DN670_c0_g1::TRINITY_DN670_c0_g1_i1::g.1582::m.1582
MNSFSFSREEEVRLKDLTKKMSNVQIGTSAVSQCESRIGVPEQQTTEDLPNSMLTEEEIKEYELLQRKFQDFIKEGERRLKHHANTLPPRMDTSNATLQTPNYFDSLKKGLYFWSTLGVMAVPGYVTQFVPGRATPLRDHWNFITDQLILGGLPIVTKVGESGDHLEKLRRSIGAREVDLITGELVTEEDTDDQMKPTLPHPTRKYELALVVSCLTQEEMDGFGINAVEFAQKWHWLERFGSGIQYEHVPMPDATADVVFDVVRKAVDAIHAVVTPTLAEEEMMSDVKKQYNKSLAMYQLQSSSNDDNDNPSSSTAVVSNVPNTAPSAAEFLPKRRVVYIHCKAGVGRSWMVLMCYLTTYKGKTFEEAYHMVKSKRNHVNPGPEQKQFVRDFQSRFIDEQIAKKHGRS